MLNELEQAYVELKVKGGKRAYENFERVHSIVEDNFSCMSKKEQALFQRICFTIAPRYCDKVKWDKIDSEHNFIKTRAHITPSCAEVEDSRPGCYLVGQIGYNPIEDRKIYAIKVGCAENLAKRIETYKTYAPLLYVADIVATRRGAERKAESCYQSKIKHMCKGQYWGTEWFEVTEATYFKVCEGGFNYLKSL